MTRVASAILSGLSRTGLPTLLAPAYGGIGSILMFHRVAEEPSGGFAPHAGLAVAPAFFEDVLRRLIDRGYDLVSLDEARQRIVTAVPGRRFACLTFDDGFRDNLDAALPICRRYGAPMTVFLATGLVDRTVRDWSFGVERLVGSVNEVALRVHGREQRLPAASVAEKRRAYEHLRRLFADLGGQAPAVAEILLARHGVDVQAISEEMFLTWEMAAEMERSGLVAFGAHSIRHVPLSGLSAAELAAEMRGSRAQIEARLRRPVAHFAYPFGGPGHAGTREFRLARELGFATAVTTRHGNVMPGHRTALHALPRLSMNGGVQTLAALDVFLSGASAALANRFRRVAAA